MKYKLGKKRRTKISGGFYEYDDATKAVEIERNLLDILKGKPGKDGECMNANCIVRNGTRFPHRVLVASVTAARVYVVDRMPTRKRPGHAVRYFLSKKDTILIKRHDKHSVSEPGTLTLRPPVRSHAAGVTHRSQHRAHTSKRNGQLTRKIPRGARARLAVAVGALNQ